MLVSGVGGTGSLSGITSVGGGEFDGLALTSGGSVDAWGYNAYGELGDSSTSDSPVPVRVSGVGGAGTLSGVTAIGAGGLDDVALFNTASSVTAGARTARSRWPSRASAGWARSPG